MSTLQATRRKPQYHKDTIQPGLHAADRRRIACRADNTRTAQLNYTCIAMAHLNSNPARLAVILCFNYVIINYVYLYYGTVMICTRTI